MKIKVLFVGMTPNPGGLETYMVNIFSKLQGNKFQFYFINIFNQKIAYSKFIKSKGGIIFNVPIGTGLVKYLIRYHIIKNFFYKFNNFDIVHINALDVNDYYWVKAAKKYNIPNIIFQSHESSIIPQFGILPLLKKIWSFYNKYLLNKDKDIVKLAASKKCGKWMFNAGSVFTVIYNGIDTKYFSPSQSLRIYYRRKLGLMHNKVLITTSRLHKQKNYPKIIKVFKCINKRSPYTKLVIIGSGEEMPKIKRLVNSLHINRDVLFLGLQNKEHISELLNIGDLMLMPSLFEGMPFSLIEAQSAGVPALVSLGIPKEANVSGSVHYLSLSKSNTFWAKKALEILNTPYNFNFRIKMNKRIKNSDYNIDTAMNRIKSIYLDMGKGEYHEN